MTFRAPRLLSRTALTTTLAAAMLAGAALVPQAAHADEQTVKLIQLLIQKGILSPNQAKDLLKETAAPKGHAKTAPVPLEAEGATAPAAAPGQIRVTYVPQFIRKQIADEVRAQVMSEAQQEGWAQPNALPEWTQRFKLYGDLRMRYEADLFDKGNYNQFLNFNNINSGSGFDAQDYGQGTFAQSNPGFLNSTTDRNQFRVRARLGTEIYIDDWISGDFRIATGSNSGPVSENQTLGGTGDFSKYSIWLDRAALFLDPLPGLQIWLGRTPNPFLPSDLMFYADLNFDGVAFKYNRDIGGGFNVFGTAGAFPLFNTAFDFSTNSETKYSSTDAYMTGLQAGVSWQFRPDIKATLGAGIFDFLGVQGAVSAPCAAQPATQFYCSTDDTRAPFVQFGNTLFAIRDIIPTGAAVPPNPQYYGLASRFNVLDVHPRVDITTYHPFDIALEGQFIDNLAFDRTAIADRATPNTAPGPVNNLGSCPKTLPNCSAPYQGGNVGYMMKVTAGNLQIHQRWDWNTSLAYRYLQTDATLDAIDDSEFHQGGTNAKGFILAGNLGIAKNTWIGLKYLSATAVSGPQYNTQTVYLDLNSSF